MKYILSIVIIFGLIFSQSHNHHFIYPDKCGSPPPNDDEIILENNIKKWLIENPNYNNRNTLNIPVAFHIIYEDNSSDGGYISETVINNQINVLNDAFLNANISFSIESIEYIQNSNWYNNDDEYTYKPQLAISPETTLNIYTTMAGGYLGYAYLPNQWSENSNMHGVVVNPYTFPGGDFWPYDEGDTTVHEVGHYLGLLHTFQNGCSGNGDYVSDTPAQDDGDNIYQCYEADTCTSAGNDPIHNYMNYTDDECLTDFTNGQIDRMNYMIDTYKPNLGCSQEYDCTGNCGGTAVEDECGVCNGTNDCFPIAINGQYTLDEDNQINIYLSATDSDGDTLIFNIVNQPSNGILTLEGVSATYSPNANFNGNDSFTFIANDGQYNSNEAIISLTVNAINDAPYLLDIPDATVESSSLFTYELQAVDVDGDELSYTVTTSGSETATLSGNMLSIAPEYGNNEVAIITVTVSDGLTTDTREFNLTIFTYGCTDINSCSYNASANVDNGSCVYPEQNYNCEGNCNNDSIELWDECYNIEETTSLNLSHIGLTGEIPSEIGNLINLTYLNLFSNDLTGGIPPEIGNLTNLTYLDLQMNQLSGHIPSEIGNLVNLIILHLNDNNLTGEIPENICNLTIDWSGIWSDYYQIPYFDIDNNNLCPYYPECLTEENIGEQNTSNCEESILGDVDLSGSINVADIVMLVNWILNDNFDEAGDLDQSGSINVADIVFLVNIILNS